MEAVHPHTHTPPLPTVCRKHSSFSGDVARGGPCTHKSSALFWEMKGLKDTCIHTPTGKGWKEGCKNTSYQVYLRRHSDIEEVGLNVCLLLEANREHILHGARIQGTAVSEQALAIAKHYGNEMCLASEDKDRQTFNSSRCRFQMSVSSCADNESQLFVQL